MVSTVVPIGKRWAWLWLLLIIGCGGRTTEEVQLSQPTEPTNTVQAIANAQTVNNQQASTTTSLPPTPTLRSTNIPTLISPTPPTTSPISTPRLIAIPPTRISPVNTTIPPTNAPIILPTNTFVPADIIPTTIPPTALPSLPVNTTVSLRPTITRTLLPSSPLTTTADMLPKCTPPACDGGELQCGSKIGCVGGCDTVCVWQTHTPAPSDQALQTPVINDFSAAKWIVSDGDQITFNWNVTNADSVDLYLGGSNGAFLYAGRPTDSFSFEWDMGYFPVPTLEEGHNTYTIVAKNSKGGYIEHRILVQYGSAATISQPPAENLRINHFSTSNTQLRATNMGGPDKTLLTWHVTGATEIEIHTLDNSPNQPIVVLHQSTDITGSYTLAYADLPTYMFTFYGLDTLDVVLVAKDAIGRTVEQAVTLSHKRDTAITAYTVSPSYIQRGDDLLVAFSATWAYAETIIATNEYGDSVTLVNETTVSGQPLPPQTIGRSYTLTWDQLTANGTFPTGQSLTIALDIGGDTAEQLITVKP